MNEILRLRVTNRTGRSQCKLNLDITKVSQVGFDNKNIRTFGPKIWISLPHRKKSYGNLETFKRVRKNWHGITCNCRVSKNYPSKMFQEHAEAILIYI